MDLALVIRRAQKFVVRKPKELVPPQRELTAEIACVRSQLKGTEGELNNVREELAKTQAELLHTRDELLQTHSELESVRREMSDVRREVCGVREQFGLNWVPKPSHLQTPLIVYNTMPKSGSVFVSRWLSEMLEVPFQPISLTYFPRDLVDTDRALMGAQQGWVTNAHLDASQLNYQVLSEATDRMIINVRDPRQATLSMVHHYNSVHRDGVRRNLHLHLLFAFVQQRPSDYFERPLDWQMEYMVEHYLPALVEWCQGWLEAEKQWSNIRLKFTRYEDLLASPDTFVRELLSFYDIPQERFVDRRPDSEEITHFRSGKADEWQDVMSSSLQAKARQLIPEDLALRFNWRLD